MPVPSTREGRGYVKVTAHIKKTGSTYSIDRHIKIEKIKNTLYRADRAAVQ